MCPDKIANSVDPDQTEQSDLGLHLSIGRYGTCFSNSLAAMCKPHWQAKLINLKNRPRQANLVLIAYASSKGSGEPAHLRSLARTFAARLYKQ